MEQLKLNMIPNGVNPVFHASQYDKGRQIRFVLDETLSSAEVTVSYRAKDGTEYGNVQMSVSGNTITDTIPEEVLTDYGIIEGEVNIDGIGSLNFFVEVEKDAYDGGVITTQTATGAIATFETNIETAFVSLKTDINPIQDLHGYSKPWSGGGGKNKLPLTVDGIKALNAGTWSGNSITLANVTFTILTDADGNVTGIKANGTSNVAMLFIIANFTLPSGSYMLNGNASGGSYDRQLQLVSGSTPIASDNGSGSSFTLSGDTSLTARIRIGNGQTLSNVEIKPMVRVSSASTNFEPYSNICPISGFSALNVTRTGVNLAKYWKNAYINANGTIITNNNNALCELGYLKSGVKIAFNHYQNTYGCGIAVYSDSSYTNKIDVNGNIQSNVSTLTLEHSGYYLFWFNVATNTASETFVNENSLGVYVGETVGTFEPYNGQTATVNFGQTVYGGKVDVTNGKVNKTHALTPLNNKSWVKSGNKFYTTGFDNAPDGALYTGDFACAIGTPVNKEWNALSVGECCLRSGLYSLNKWSFVYCSDAYATVEEFVSALNADCTITYPLATPTEITTTPENLTAISGENNVYGDTNGDTTVEYYIEV